MANDETNDDYAYQTVEFSVLRSDVEKKYEHVLSKIGNDEYANQEELLPLLNGLTDREASVLPLHYKKKMNDLFKKHHPPKCELLDLENDYTSVRWHARVLTKEAQREYAAGVGYSFEIMDSFKTAMEQSDGSVLENFGRWSKAVNWPEPKKTS